ncbi:hypothetical protein AYO38_05700 [bacterium SCGC AG-212-C10]|nr:hypothetical protein AYO38_05700 [bacterium SCGC AG-212-C10]
MTAQLRFATPADANALAQLRYDFRSVLGEATESPEGFVARCSAWMAERLADSNRWRCWVAVRDTGSIDGCLWLQLIEKVPNPVPELEQHAYITNVYVRPEARGGGVGELIVGAAMAWCRDQGIDSAILWPTERSRSLYERHGFAVRADLMEAIVNEGRDLHGSAEP